MKNINPLFVGLAIVSSVRLSHANAAEPVNRIVIKNNCAGKAHVWVKNQYQGYLLAGETRYTVQEGFDTANSGFGPGGQLVQNFSNGGWKETSSGVRIRIISFDAAGPNGTTATRSWSSSLWDQSTVLVVFEGTDLPTELEAENAGPIHPGATPVSLDTLFQTMRDNPKATGNNSQPKRDGRVPSANTDDTPNVPSANTYPPVREERPDPVESSTVRAVPRAPGFPAAWVGTYADSECMVKISSSGTATFSDTWLDSNGHKQKESVTLHLTPMTTADDFGIKHDYAKDEHGNEYQFYKWFTSPLEFNIMSEMDLIQLGISHFNVYASLEKQ
jgi:hypothetical protein